MSIREMTAVARSNLSDRFGSGYLAQGAAILLGSALLALSAQIQVPAWPVPITMQSLAVVMLGIVLGPRLGAAAVLAYLIEGAAGLPVFAGFKGGLAHLAGPTAGYLVGFWPAAWLAGQMAGAFRTAGWSRLLMAMLAGHALLLATGASWLAVFVGAGKATALGFVPFIVGSFVKSALGAACLQLFQRPPRG